VVCRSIPIEKGSPGYAVVNPNTNIIYISYSSSNFILAVDLKKGTVGAKIPAKSPGNIVVNNSTNKVYISSEPGIYEIDGIDNQYHIINVGLPRSNGNVDINPLTNLIYTTCFGHDILTVIDPATRAIADKIPVGKNPKGVAVDSCANKIYVANYDSESISIIDCNHSHKLIDTISMKQKWDSSEIRNPFFILINVTSNLLYVQTHISRGYEGGAVELQRLYLVNFDTKKTINTKSLYENANVGLAFDSNNNTIYMRKLASIMEFDAFASKKKVLAKIDLRYTSIWKRVFSDGYEYFAEVIAVNPTTNKVYISDSKNNLLYEIDG
jgi:YVTN family beta-propeller protein